MPKKTRHENIYIALSVFVYAVLIAAYFLPPWPHALKPWYYKLTVLVTAAAVYEGILWFVVKKFK